MVYRVKNKFDVRYKTDQKRQEIYFRACQTETLDKHVSMYRPTEHLCILVPAPFGLLAPFLHKFSAVMKVMHFFCAICIKFKNIDAETEPSKVVFEMNLEHKIQSIKKSIRLALL